MRFPKKEEEFNRWLVREYFKYGTVDEVLRKHRFSIPISYANYQRVLNKWGVVKKAGPNNKLTEAIDFFSHLAKDNLSFEELYSKVPLRFQTSAKTFYRIFQYIKEGLTRRVGVGLIITPFNSQTKILLGRDVSTPRIELGKAFGQLSLPMGYARKRDSRRINILRILQQEVFTEEVINRTLTEIIPGNPEPFMYLDIADVRVALYHLQLPQNVSKLTDFFSYKLRDYKFVGLEEILTAGKGFRVGIKEAVLGYKKYLGLIARNLSVNPIQARSVLNRDLATIEVDVLV